MSTAIRYPAYRRYRAGLIAANDAMMALMIGARLGKHSLETFPADEDALLPQIFGAIDGIERVNRTKGDAARLLEHSEQYLASMGIPYVLGVHGAFVSDSLQMLRDDGKDEPDVAGRALPRVQDLTQMPLGSIHAYFEERVGESLPEELMAIFHLARRIRNRILHFGGVAGSRLPKEYTDLPQAVRDRWEGVTDRPLTTDSNGLIALGDGELYAVLGSTRRLGHCINVALAKRLSREYWLGVIAGDYRRAQPGRYGEKQQRPRRLARYARMYYRPLDLTEQDFEQYVAGK